MYFNKSKDIIYTDTYDLLSKTVATLKTHGYDSMDIQDFLLDATSTNNMHLVETCTSYLWECLPSSEDYYTSYIGSTTHMPDDTF